MKQRKLVAIYSLSVHTGLVFMGRVSGYYLHTVLTCFCLCQGADIDTLLVAPRHVDRSDFFSSFIEVLLKEKGVSNVRVSVKCYG